MSGWASKSIEIFASCGKVIKYVLDLCLHLIV